MGIIQLLRGDNCIEASAFVLKEVGQTEVVPAEIRADDVRSRGAWRPSVTGDAPEAKPIPVDAPDANRTHLKRHAPPVNRARPQQPKRVIPLFPFRPLETPDHRVVLQIQQLKLRTDFQQDVDDTGDLENQGLLDVRRRKAGYDRDRLVRPAFPPQHCNPGMRGSRSPSSRALQDDSTPETIAILEKSRAANGLARLDAEPVQDRYFEVLQPGPRVHL